MNRRSRSKSARGGGRWRWLALATLGLFALAPTVPMPVVNCPCDHAHLASMKSRVCSLCRTAEDATEEIYFLKDINPRKPSRYLALPKAHDHGFQSTIHLARNLRSKLWTRAIQRAEELYPGRWGLAQNSHFFRTQCHAHIHIGPLSPEVVDEGGRLYATVDDMPEVGPAQGIWLHPKEGQYCVHLDRDLAEIVLVK